MTPLWIKYEFHVLKCFIYIYVYIYIYVFICYFDLLKPFKYFWVYIYPCKQLPPLCRMWTLPLSQTLKHSPNLLGLAKGYILMTWSNWRSQDSATLFLLKKRILFYFSVYDCWLTEILLGNPKGTLRKGIMCSLLSEHHIRVLIQFSHKWGRSPMNYQNISGI